MLRSNDDFFSLSGLKAGSPTFTPKACNPFQSMITIAEQGTNCKRVSKLCFSNFTAFPLTDKKSPWI